MSHKGNVYVIDDDPAMRDSLDFLLGTAGFEVTLFVNASDFLDASVDLRFGCVVSDVRMPGIDGMDLIRRLKTNASPLPIIIMTGHGDIPLAVEAIKLGALDFIEKPFEDEVLIEAIKRAAERMGGTPSAQDDATAVRSRLEQLSERERQVLSAVVAGLPNKTIAYDLNISPRTVEVHRANVMAKMQAKSLPELVRMTLSAGLGDD